MHKTNGRHLCAVALTSMGREVEVFYRTAFIIRNGGDTTVFDVEVDGDSSLFPGSYENLSDAKTSAAERLAEPLAWRDIP